MSLWRGPAIATAMALSGGAMAAVYQEPETFLNETFNGEPPAPEVVWVTEDHRARLRQILGHPPRELRIRYWGRDTRTAWILEEIGKEKPITVGIVVGPKGIERVKVLIFRESRGYEVRHPFFTKQFRGAELASKGGLSQPIDGISGATLSVRALKKLARMALYLHGQTEFAHGS